VSLYGRLFRAVGPITQFGQSAAKLVGGTAVAQVIAFSAAPILTRLYEPSAFGVLATLTGIVGTLIVISSLCYDASIPIVRGRHLGANVKAVCLGLLGTSVILSAIVVVVWLDPIAVLLFKNDQSPITLLFIPLLLVCGGIAQIASAVALRAGAFAVIAKSKVLQALLTAASQPLLFLSGSVGLVAGLLIGQVIGAAYLWRFSTERKQRVLLTMRSLSRAMLRLKRSPLLEMPFSLINSAGNYLPPVILTICFGATVGGIFALSLRVISAPISLITSAAAQVFIVSATKAHRDRRLGALVAHVSGGIIKLTMPALLLIAVGGADIFEIVFGEKWRDAGRLASWLTPWLLMQAIGSPLSSIWIVQGNLHHGLMFGIMGFVLRASALLAALWIDDWMFVVWLLSAANTLYYLSIVIYAMSCANCSVHVLLRVGCRSFVNSAAFALPLLCGIIVGGTVPVMIGLFVSIVIGVPHYARAIKSL